MGDVVRFPRATASCPTAGVYGQARDSLEDLAELLESPGLCGHGELLQLLCESMVQHLGAEEALEHLRAAGRVILFRFETIPPGGAA